MIQRRSKNSLFTQGTCILIGERKLKNKIVPLTKAIKNEDSLREEAQKTGGGGEEGGTNLSLQLNLCSSYTPMVK